MSVTLVIECSTPQATVALVDGDGVTQREFTSDRNHNAMLFEPLQELIPERKDIERVLVGSGPGSYSGTRVGIAAAQGIGLALGCPVIALPSILAVSAADEGKCCLAIGDARRGSYWTAKIAGNTMEHEPQLCELDGLKEILSASGADVTVFAFEPAEQFPVEELQPKIELQHPDATRLWRTWQQSSEEQQAAWQAEIAQPIYLKPPHITPGKRARLI
ncbi:MAG: tRNA (adenosine(37)-N6)-threonylcarbamoyltransferase complex dimerization subunit type 1 TsaB [Akkermansiaceae bacterium]|nr:tRNA (adenosine(37)-N6)-threonylcarbamoyltransferase complex dimerization subunit type 1 TsaB [Akkermansiaceae bacterium]